MLRRRLALALSAALVMALGVVVPSASAAPACTYYWQRPDVVLESVVAVYKDYGKVTVTAQVSNDCGTITGVNSVVTNSSTGSTKAADLSLLTSGPIQTWRADADVSGFPYGKFTVPTITVKSNNGQGYSYSEDFTPNPPVSLFNRMTPELSNPSPATQTVNEGDSVALSGWFYTYWGSGYPTEKVNLQVQDGTTWTTVQTENPQNGAFSFIYKPTKSVTYRFAYDQTDWANAKTSTAAVINFVPKTVVTKPPSAPSAFISGTTTSTISLNWSVPGDPNGTISAYRFGWSAPSGKPVPEWEDTFPTSNGIIDPFTFTKLAADTDYTVWIEAVNENGRSARTSILARTKAVPVTPPPTTPPPTPTVTVTPPTPTVTVTPPVPAPTVTPPPPPAPKQASVYVAAVSKASKLYVDVDPNKGKGYWKFRVQKWTGTTWKYRGGTYKTKGSKETRTINLPKGSYRVVVKSKYGYLGNVSEPVFLKR